MQKVLSGTYERNNNLHRCQHHGILHLYGEATIVQVISNYEEEVHILTHPDGDLNFRVLPLVWIARNIQHVDMPLSGPTWALVMWLVRTVFSRLLIMKLTVLNFLSIQVQKWNGLTTSIMRLMQVSSSRVLIFLPVISSYHEPIFVSIRAFSIMLPLIDSCQVRNKAL